MDGWIILLGNVCYIEEYSMLTPKLGTLQYKHLNVALWGPVSVAMFLSCSICKHQESSTYGSNTSRVMYSLGMRGNWWEKTFCSPTSHIRIFLLDFWESEFPMTWNSIMPRLSSNLAVSSRAAFGVSRFVYQYKWNVLEAEISTYKTLMLLKHNAVITNLRSKHGSGIGNGHHDFIDQLHRNVSHHTDPLGVFQRQCLGKFTFLS